MSALTPQDKERATTVVSTLDSDFDNNNVLSALRATFDAVNQRADPHRVPVPTWATQQAARDRAKQVLRARLGSIFPRESVQAAGDPYSRDVKIATRVSVKGVPPAKGEKAPAVPEVFRLEVVPTTGEADKILRESHISYTQKGAAEAVKQKINGAEAATGAKRQDGVVATHLQVALDKEKVKKNTAAVKTLLAGAGTQKGFLTATGAGDVVAEFESAEATGSSEITAMVGKLLAPVLKATPFGKKTPSEIATLVLSYLKVRVASSATRKTFADSQSWTDLAANGAVDFELALRRDAIVAAMGSSIADAAAKGGAFCTPAVQADLATLLSMDCLRAVNLEVELAPLPYTFVDMVRGLSVQTRYQRLAPAPGKEVDLAKAAITDGCGPEQFIATSISRMLRLGNGGSDLVAACALNLLRPKAAPGAAAVRAAGELGGHIKGVHVYTGALKAKFSMDLGLDGLVSDELVATMRGFAAAYLAATKGATLETLPPFGEVYQALTLKHSLEIEQCFGKGVDTKAVRKTLPAAYDGALYQRMHPMDAVCCVLVLNLDPTPVHALRLLGGFNVTSHLDERGDGVYRQLAEGKPLAGVFKTTVDAADAEELKRLSDLPFWGMKPDAAKTSTPFVTVGPLAGTDSKEKPAEREQHRALKFVVADSQPRVADIAGALAVADAVIVVQGAAATAEATAAINNGTHPTLQAVQEAYKATPQVGAKVAAETPILYVTTRARAATDAKLPVPSLLPASAKADSKVNTLVLPIDGRRATAAQGAQVRRWIEQAAGAADACGEGAGTWDWLPADYPIVDRLNLRHFV